jgi:methionyl-tRNA synthetase
MYVWLDALTNYITALGYPDTDADLYKKFWPADLHMVGKDILRFHAIYWPAFLMAAGLAPPKRIYAHGWWTNEGQKISKSLGNVIDPYELLQNYGLDQTRYFLMREVPFGGDGDFSREAMVRRINSDLANGIGNLAQRSLSQIAKNCDGKLPQPGDFMDTDKTLLEAARLLPAQVRAEIDVQAFHKALDAIWKLIGEADVYINDMAPWSLKKTDTARMGTVLYVVADVLHVLGILLQPFMPETSGKLLDQLGVAADARNFAQLDQALKPGSALPAPQGLFPRYVEPTAAA